MNPHHMDGEIAVFTTEQIDLYGDPEYFGYSKFYVVNNTESPMVMDYAMENGDGRNKFRPIHRYNRLERFTSIICTLLGGKESIPQDVIDSTFLVESWDECRSALKVNGYQKYYNYIPTIMCIHGLAKPIRLDLKDGVYMKLLNDFRVFQAAYNDFHRQGLITRKYFPSLRYIAFKIMEDNYAEFNDVTFIRTPRKQKALDDIWDMIHDSYA